LYGIFSSGGIETKRKEVEWIFIKFNHPIDQKRIFMIFAAFFNLREDERFDFRWCSV
jgi:hypothetical protein